MVWIGLELKNIPTYLRHDCIEANTLVVKSIYLFSSEARQQGLTFVHSFLEPFPSVRSIHVL